MKSIRTSLRDRPCLANALIAQLGLTRQLKNRTAPLEGSLPARLLSPVRALYPYILVSLHKD